MAPVRPVAPVAPIKPVAPVTLTPVAPVRPVAPVAPVKPVAPVGPVCCWKVMVAVPSAAVAVTPSPTILSVEIPAVFPTTAFSSITVIPASLQVQAPEPFAVKT